MSNSIDLTNPQTEIAKAQPRKSLAEMVKNITSTIMQDEKRLAQFTTDIINVCNITPKLKECSVISLVGSGLQAQALGLSLSPGLGQAWMIPFKRKYKDNKNQWTFEMLATFQIGYKGYLQLAMRSGNYSALNAIAVKKGEIISYDYLTEELEFRPVENEGEREKLPTVGYVAVFRYTNGFKKVMYWSNEKMKAHAVKHSEAYKADLQYGNTHSYWSKDFDSMALKTMLRQLISKWGIMSVEFQKALDSDMHIMNSNGNIEFPDTFIDADISEETKEEIIEPEIIPQEPTEPTQVQKTILSPFKGKYSKADLEALDELRKEALAKCLSVGIPTNTYSCDPSRWNTSQCKIMIGKAETAEQSFKDAEREAETQKL